MPVFTRKMPRLASQTVLLLTLAVSLINSPARAADIPVETEGDYQRLLDAIRATEYTRQSYIEENANPRMIAAVAGLWAFSERNPLATPEQFTAFVSAYDASLAAAIPTDPTLARSGSMLIALNTARVAPEGVLEGTNTRVGRRASALLGIELPGLESFEQSQQRMARFELAAAQRWINRTYTADALTSVLACVDPSGQRVEGLAIAGASYLESLGFSPMLGQVDPNQIEVNAGLAGLPDFAGFIAIRDTAGAHGALEAEVFSGIDAIQIDAEATLAQIGQATVPSGLATDSVDLFAAAADPDHPDHAAAVAFLEARRQALIDSFRATADERASVFARTMLLQQSSYPDVVYAAQNARSFAGLQLQVNNELAIARESVGIFSSLGGLATAYSTGNLMGGASSLAGVVSGVFAVADILGDGPPSVDQQILDQIAGLQQQVEDLRVQMNERFDIVDAKLDVIYGTMITAFGFIQDGIDTLIADIASVRSTLDRIEEALFGFAQNLLLVDLTTQTDEVLDYRNKTGFDLAYNNQSPSFVGASSGFTTFATFTAQTSAFAGVEDGQPLTLTIDNASDLLSGDAAVARLINDFRRIPSGLFTSDGQPVLGPITSGRTPAPAPWSQSAAAYAQLARENPWYFAYMLESQQNAGGSNDPQITQIINQGQRISSLAAATRDRDDLFNALLQRATDDVSILQSLAQQSIDDELIDLGMSNGSVTIDAWGAIDQTASPLVATVSSVAVAGNVTNPQNFTHRGYEMFFADNRIDISADYSRAQLAERLAMIRAVRPDLGMSYVAQVQPGGQTVTILLRATNSRTLAERRLQFRIQYQVGGSWITWTDFSPTSFYQERLQRSWAPLSLALEGGNVTGLVFQSGFVRIGCCTQYPARLVGLSDSSNTGMTNNMLPLQADAIVVGLAQARTSIRDRLAADLAAPTGDFADASARLDDTRALLDGYLTLGASDALGTSEILRAALRGIPGAGGMWLDSPEWIAVINAAGDADTGDLGGPDIIDIPSLLPHFDQRVAALGSEVALALDTPAPSFPYVEFMLAELRDLRDNAFDLATDDTYLAPGSISIDAAAGLMANDIGQPGRINNEDLMVDPDFFGSLDHTPPMHGSLSVAPDGSFSYTPDPGFEGTDSFNYRLVAQVGDPDNPVGNPDVYSTPARVVLRVTAAACIADLNGDGQLNFFDVSAFLVAYGDEDPLADLNNDGLYNFFDVSAFLVAYSDGCP